jgi:hypothetical protein
MPPNLKTDSLSPNDLLLDPNNNRFQDIEDFVYVEPTRFHEEGAQKRAFERLKREESLVALKNSILRNGFIPIERIVVRPYKTPKGDKWLVIEGNRRLAAVKWILDDNEAGVKTDAEVLKSIEKLPVVIAEEKGPDEVFRMSLMGIRHVSGIRVWGGYQRAKLVAQMRDDLNVEPGETAERLGLSTHEVNRRYRAFKALQQMQEDDDFSGFAKPSMYPIFHEAVSNTAVRTWLDWDDDRNQFKNEANLRVFYGLITPAEGDDDEQPSEPKIKSYSQVRELRAILSKPETLKILTDPKRPFEDALALAKSEEMFGHWQTEVLEALHSIEAMSVQEVKTLSEDNCKLLLKLIEVAKERIQDHQSLVEAAQN